MSILLVSRLVAVRILMCIVFAVIYGLTGLREMLTKKSEDKSGGIGGYTRLPH